MKASESMEHIFVKRIPEYLVENTLYVCLETNTIIHKCACGCGEETITPIDIAKGWTFFYDGKNITLSPSIGNFNYKCKSHYFIKNSKVEWC